MKDALSGPHLWEADRFRSPGPVQLVFKRRRRTGVWCGGAVGFGRTVEEVAVRDYDYEFRHGDSIVATGRLAFEEPVEVGHRVTIGGQRGIVRRVSPAFADRLQRVIVELRPENVR